MATLGCIKGKMGSTTYYMAKMSAGELIDRVGIAKELPEWPAMTAEEKMQRECNIKRVVDEIVPYIIEDPDRFFPSLIIDIFSGFEDIEYENIAEALPNVPKAYLVPMRDMGFITLPGKERLIALDGQHRLLSLKIAIRGIMGVPAGTKTFPSMNRLTPHPELANEEISVIFVKHTDTQKIRKIFNKINKYAKQTSRSDNIITSDDDTFAVIARRLINEGGPLAPVNGIDLVNWKSNTLSARSKNLTTLSSLYTIAETLLKDKKYSSKHLPADDEMESAYNEVAIFWQKTLTSISVFQNFMELTEANKPVSSLREENILLKPVTQMALAHVAAMAKRKRLDWSDICNRLNRVDWSFNNELWFNVLIIGSTNKKMMTGKDAVRGAGMIISYLVMGDVFSQAELDDVTQIIRNARNDAYAALPEMV